MVREAHGLEQLMTIAKDKSLRENKALVAAATGAIWKCALVEKNIKQFHNVSFEYYFRRIKCKIPYKLT